MKNLPENETTREELLMRDVKILFDENRRLKNIIEELEKLLKEKKTHALT